jgi:hypothetical protein
MVALALKSAPIGLSKDRFDFVGVEIALGRTGGTLGRHMQNGGTLRDGRRLARGEECKECA